MRNDIRFIAALFATFLLASCSTTALQDEVKSTQITTTSNAVAQQPLGIMSAMDVELNYLLSKAKIDEVVSIGGNDFSIGTLEGQRVVIVKAGVGKSLSAACTAILINQFNVSGIVFTGIAGGVSPDVKIADVVISTHLMLHDYGYLGNDDLIALDSDFVSKVEVKADEQMEQEAYKAATTVLGAERVFEGLIATGDQFIANEKYVNYLYNTYGVYAVEMEGASVGYVAEQYNVPFVVIRSLSDKADGLAHDEYQNWYSEVSDNSGKIVMQFMKNRASN